jgi:hypothetical protein
MGSTIVFSVHLPFPFFISDTPRMVNIHLIIAFIYRVFYDAADDRHVLFRGIAWIPRPLSAWSSASSSPHIFFFINILGLDYSSSPPLGIVFFSILCLYRPLVLFSPFLSVAIRNMAAPKVLPVNDCFPVSWRFFDFSREVRDMIYHELHVKNPWASQSQEASVLGTYSRGRSLFAAIMRTSPRIKAQVVAVLYGRHYLQFIVHSHGLFAQMTQRWKIIIPGPFPDPTETVFMAPEDMYCPEELPEGVSGRGLHRTVKFRGSHRRPQADKPWGRKGKKGRKQRRVECGKLGKCLELFEEAE